MSKLEVNTIAPRTGTAVTLGETGDTINLGTGVSSGTGMGKILQVQQASNTNAHTTTSSSFTTIETVNITPQYANSIIKLTFTGRSYTAVLTVEHGSRFVRDSTELETYLGQWTANGATAQRETFEFYDTPNTTSQITYKFEHRVISAGNQMHFSPNGAGDGGVYLTAMEIAQ